jgi:alkanesulfonate monooxygenase SsuD/methylene tetrahydromethanopterin reductase-like flavin-dependent oxidoreductase (luciferase family)
VNGVTYRHPSVLAAQAATVDQISGGRLEFSLGAAWYEQEHAQLGIEFPAVRERAERLDEALTVIRLLWTRDGASFDGAHYPLRDATYHPRPAQRPHPPIWIGASGEKVMLPIVARHADVWHAFGSVESLQHKSSVLDRLTTEAGRDPKTIGRSTNVSLSGPLDAIRRTVDGLRAAGFSYLVASWPGEGRARVDEFVERIMPAHAKE